MKVGVIGAGTMGSGIAQVFAQTDGYEVVLMDIKQEFADGGKAKIEKIRVAGRGTHICPNCQRREDD